MRRLMLFLAALLAAPLVAAPARAQWSTTYEQSYLQAPHNWVFRRQYAGADRLFNAFDYGHAILYETLWTKPDAPASELEKRRFDYLTRKVLVSPPHVPLEEAAIEVHYARLAPEAKAMFDWAHILHRQLYDVLADERLDQVAKDREVQRLVEYYKTRRDLAFSSKPKSMKLMQEQPYSLAFRQKYPKFNGLIWAYHWMQVGLYEPLMVGRTAEERQAGVRGTVARFWQMLGDPPHTFPYQMPMTAAIAPTFAARYPEAAIIFDNLHSMHDVVSDILANPSVPRGRKRAEILLAARRFRDDTSYVMSQQAWLTMAHHMGVENMGGPSVGYLAALPTPTVTYGAVMTHDDATGEMTGFTYGQATGGAHAGHAMGAVPGAAAGAHAGHDSAAAAAAARADTGHAGHGAMPGMRTDTTHGAMHAMHGMGSDSAHAGHSPEHMQGMMALHERMMADPVIRRRVQADTTMRRMMDALMADMPAEHRAHHEAMMDAPGRVTKETAPARSSATAKSSARRAASPTTRRGTPAATKPAADPHAGHTTPAPKATKKPADPHAGHKMPDMPGMSPAKKP
jgi:hypothetical protein